MRVLCVEMFKSNSSLVFLLIISNKKHKCEPNYPNAEKQVSFCMNPHRNSATGRGALFEENGKLTVSPVNL